MNPTSLLLNNKPFSYEQIKSGDYKTLTPFEECTLLFCQKWLNGQEVFEQQTSGSTGKPKTIKITRAQMQLSAKLTVEALNLAENDAALVCIDTAFVGGKMMLVRAFEHNLQLIIQEPSSNPLENIDTPIDFVAMVPLQFENSYNSSFEKIKNCKAIILGGAPVSINLQNEIAKLTTPIYSTYGMTETASHIAIQKLSNPPEKQFTTLGDIEISINDKDQLILKGSITNNQKIITNDRVNILTNNQFRWLGRADNVVNSGGIKIQLEEIEAIISSKFSEHNIKNRFFLAGVPDKKYGQRLVLYLEGTEPLKQGLLDLLSSNLPKLKNPKEVIYLEKFKETPTGKIKRRGSVTLI